jgi:transcriptional repressor NrdR
MICPKCQHDDTRVLDSRDTDGQKAVRRRRECAKCKHRFTTFERAETTNFVVVKRDGTRVNYDREKVVRGMWKACEKRKVTQEQVGKVVNELEEEWSKIGKEVSSKVIGEGIMEALKDLDEVAYIRFASVYRQFKDLETFRKELEKLEG